MDRFAVWAVPLVLLAAAALSWPAPAGAQGTGAPSADAVQTEPLAPLLPLPPAPAPAEAPAEAPAQTPAETPAAAPAEAPAPSSDQVPAQATVQPAPEPAPAPAPAPTVETAPAPAPEPAAATAAPAPAPEPAPAPATPAPAQPVAAVPGEETMRAILQGLDKTTARVSTVEAPVGGVAHFGTLEIVARACHKKPPTEPPESAAFLEITDVRPDSPAVRVFSGWMFASSPALSALEHPVYDIWVIDCRKGPPAKTAGPPEEAASSEAVPLPEVTGDIPEDSEAAPPD